MSDNDVLYNLNIEELGNYMEKNTNNDKDSTTVKKTGINEEKTRVGNKVYENVQKCLDDIGLKDGMTIAFHQHFKDGDYVVNEILSNISKMGIKNLTLVIGVIENVHAPIIEHIKNKVISKIITNGLKGPVAETISKGIMEEPVIITSYGEKAREIKSGEIKIDIGFLGIPNCDSYGNGNCNCDFSCGSLGFFREVLDFSETKVLVTGNLVEFPNLPATVRGEDVDFIIRMDSIADVNGILPKMIKYTKNPREILVGNYAFEFIKESGYMKDKFSFKSSVNNIMTQTIKRMKDYLVENNICASYYIGEVFNPIVEMKQEGALRIIVDTQSADLSAVQSIRENRGHIEGSSMYYSETQNSLINKIDINISTALEVDVDFNANFITTFDGFIKGQLDSYCEVAEYAKLNILIFPLIKGRVSAIMRNVKTICAKSDKIDAVVTDRGIVINPRRKDLIDKFKNSKLPICTIEELYEKSVKLIGVPNEIAFGDRVVAVIKNINDEEYEEIREVMS